MPRNKKYLSYFASQLQSLLKHQCCRLFLSQQAYTAKKGSFVKRCALSLCLFLPAFYFSSCEKVIQVDLNNADKKYVIEATITDHLGSCKVIITQTKNFNENNTFNGVSGALVTITDNNASPQTLAETSAGIYEAPSLTGISLHTYQLNVKVAGKVFTASSVMPTRVPVDSMYITERTFFDETNKYATLRYRDPAGEKNAYRFIQYVNGVKEKTVFVRDDDSNDGLSVERTLLFFYDDDEEDAKRLKSGDSLRVEMLCISLPVYKYWYSLTESSTGENQSATPGNPVTNIQGGALGYFSAHTTQSKALIIP